MACARAPAFTGEVQVPDHARRAKPRTEGQLLGHFLPPHPPPGGGLQPQHCLVLAGPGSSRTNEALLPRRSWGSDTARLWGPADSNVATTAKQLACLGLNPSAPQLQACDLELLLLLWVFQSLHCPAPPPFQQCQLAWPCTHSGLWWPAWPSCLVPSNAGASHLCKIGGEHNHACWFSCRFWLL